MTTTAHSQPRAAKSRIGRPAAASIAGASSPASKGRTAAPASAPAALSAIERVRLARNPSRPQTLDYVEHLLRDFFEIHGDRRFADDGAIVAGLGYFGRRAVAIVGHQRGRSTQERIRRNFGKPHPEGYRKAARMYDLAGRMGLPLVTFIDTQGAEPGLGAEERGQAEAIARSTETCLNLGVPNIAVIVGEGGSGGAIAIATANRVLMLEHAIYSVISPEGAASILWRDTSKAEDAATNMKITAEDLMRFGIIDEIIPEPVGGAHRDPPAAIAATGAAIERVLAEVKAQDRETVRRSRRDKFLNIGRSIA